MMTEAMSDKIVAHLMKQACTLAGLDPRKFSGHSLRRGLLTTAGDLQLPLVDLMRQSRHKSVDTALRGGRPIRAKTYGSVLHAILWGRLAPA